MVLTLILYFIAFSGEAENPDKTILYLHEGIVSGKRER